MAKHVIAQSDYHVRARTISGTHEDKLEQIDTAIQELLDIKLAECVDVDREEDSNVRFLAVPSRSHGRAMFLAILVMLVLLVWLLSTRTAKAQTIEFSPQLHAGAFVDVGHLKDFNSPSNHLFRTRGTTPRVDELDLNMAAAYVKKTVTVSSRWGLEATIQGGRDSQVFGFSATAPNLSGADWLRRLGLTNVSYLAPAGRGLTLQGGIFSSFIGYDSLYAKDSFAYTRPWTADFTPYLMLGVTGSYPVTDRLTVAGFVVNGYWHLAHANDVPSVGGQMAYALTPHVTLKQTALYGPHQRDTSIDRWRLLSDTIVERKVGRLTTAGELQLSSETVAHPGARASWIAAQAPIHVALTGPWSVTLRPELARDRSGRWTGVSQTVIAMTSGLEYRKPAGAAQIILRAEHRYDHSSGDGAGFFKDEGVTPGQHLFVVAVIVGVERTR